MMSDNTIYVRHYERDDARFSINEREVWRYSGVPAVANEVPRQLQEVYAETIAEGSATLMYRVCYLRLRRSELQSLLYSKDLEKCLLDSEEVLLLAATIGMEYDRLIAKYSRISPTKALILQAFGAERVECLCDVFCKEYGEECAAKGQYLTPRFSPGYGDLPLTVQKTMFSLLDCNRKIGVSLNESMLMSPSKSVTAIIGLRNCETKPHKKNCSACAKRDCLFREEGL